MNEEEVTFVAPLSGTVTGLTPGAIYAIRRAQEEGISTDASTETDDDE